MTCTVCGKKMLNLPHNIKGFGGHTVEFDCCLGCHLKWNIYDYYDYAKWKADRNNSHEPT
jgi:hypothetical protein